MFGATSTAGSVQVLGGPTDTPTNDECDRDADQRTDGGPSLTPTPDNTVPTPTGFANAQPDEYGADRYARRRRIQGGPYADADEDGTAGTPTADEHGAGGYADPTNTGLGRTPTPTSTAPSTPERRRHGHRDVQFGRWWRRRWGCTIGTLEAPAVNSYGWVCRLVCSSCGAAPVARCCLLHTPGGGPKGSPSEIRSVGCASGPLPNPSRFQVAQGYAYSQPKCGVITPTTSLA